MIATRPAAPRGTATVAMPGSEGPLAHELALLAPHLRAEVRAASRQVGVPVEARQVHFGTCLAPEPRTAEQLGPGPATRQPLGQQHVPACTDLAVCARQGCRGGGQILGRADRAQLVRRPVADEAGNPHRSLPVDAKRQYGHKPAVRGLAGKR